MRHFAWLFITMTVMWHTPKSYIHSSMALGHHYSTTVAQRVLHAVACDQMGLHMTASPPSGRDRPCGYSSLRAKRHVTSSQLSGGCTSKQKTTGPQYASLAVSKPLTAMAGHQCCMCGRNIANFQQQACTQAGEPAQMLVCVFAGGRHSPCLQATCPSKSTVQVQQAPGNSSCLLKGYTVRRPAR